jgi:hypothetical protein
MMAATCCWCQPACWLAVINLSPRQGTYPRSAQRHGCKIVSKPLAFEVLYRATSVSRDACRTESREGIAQYEFRRVGLTIWPSTASRTVSRIWSAIVGMLGKAGDVLDVAGDVVSLSAVHGGREHGSTEVALRLFIIEQLGTWQLTAAVLAASKSGCRWVLMSRHWHQLLSGT